MDLDYSSEELAFRDEVRGWLRENLPADLRRKVESYGALSKDELLRWHRILADKGWIAPAWPIEWGGTSWNVVQRYIFEEECGYAAAPPLIPFGLAMCAPVLFKFGTEDQKKRFLPRIYRGDDFWCQGYSEPSSGSDLASLRTAAVRDGDRYVVNGQKTWTTLAHMADWIFCLVRTDSALDMKQEGISFLLIDMKTPGITVRPLRLMDGGHEVNEVFFDDVRVPAANLVFEEGKGWTVAKYLLGYERMNTGRIGASKRELERLKELAAREMKNGKPLLAVGGSGGPTIVTGVLQVMLDVLDFHLGPGVAVDLPRIHEQAAPETVIVEEKMPAQTTSALTQMGYRLRMVPMLGAVGALKTEPGKLKGAADARKGGTASGY